MDAQQAKRTGKLAVSFIQFPHKFVIKYGVQDSHGVSRRHSDTGYKHMNVDQHDH